MNTDELYKRTKEHLILLQSSPGEVQEWDVYKKAMEIVNIMHVSFFSLNFVNPMFFSVRVLCIIIHTYFAFYELSPWSLREWFHL